LRIVANIAEKRMFGGIAFLHFGHMCCDVVGNVLMVRVGPDAYEEPLGFAHTREMDFTGKPLKGFVYVDPPGFVEDDQLREWIAKSHAFTTSLPPN
jgi:hypothetical protein